MILKVSLSLSLTTQSTKEPSVTDRIYVAFKYTLTKTLYAESASVPGTRRVSLYFSLIYWSFFNPLNNTGHLTCVACTRELASCRSEHQGEDA